MNTPSKEAREAAIKIINGTDASMEHLQSVMDEVQTAIDKATQAEDLMYRYHNDAKFHAFVERVCYETLESYENHRESRAAQPQEWMKRSLGKDLTGIEMFEVMEGDKQVATACGDNADAFVTAHNATLEP